MVRYELTQEMKLSLSPGKGGLSWCCPRCLPPLGNMSSERASRKMLTASVPVAARKLWKKKCPFSPIGLPSCITSHLCFPLSSSSPHCSHLVALDIPCFLIPPHPKPPGVQRWTPTYKSIIQFHFDTDYLELRETLQFKGLVSYDCLNSLVSVTHISSHFEGFLPLPSPMGLIICWNGSQPELRKSVKGSSRPGRA